MFLAFVAVFFGLFFTLWLVFFSLSIIVIYLHRQSLCYSMNSLFLQPNLQIFVATKCIHFESVHFDQQGSNLGRVGCFK